LVRTPEGAVLLDAGPGAFSKLALAIDYTQLDAIVVSHMHADHFFDLVPFRYALKYGPRRSAGRVPLWLPPGGSASLDALRRAVSTDAPATFFDDVFEVGEYDPMQGLLFGDLRLDFAQTRHFINTFAIRAERGGASVVYSADTAPCEAVVNLARDAAIFLCEAALGLSTEAGERGHTSASEAGEMAQRAGVDRLALTHYSAAEPGDALVEAAKRQFHGPVVLADDGMDLPV
jgi:ribonuclease BN (tRNA processing enzyme)